MASERLHLGLPSRVMEITNNDGSRLVVPIPEVTVLP
jgi:hypothetical protein